jgi:hypothetical protein
MKFSFATAVISAAVVAAAVVAGAAQASGPHERNLSRDNSGYHFRGGKFDPYTDGIRQVDPYTDCARQVDPYTDGARIVAGLDRSGVSADPS